jgi:hypothetical protein
MRSKTLTAIVLSATVLIPAAATAAVSRPSPLPDNKPARPIRWLAVGDSYSSGEGLDDVSEPNCQRADEHDGHTSAAWAVDARRALGENYPIAADTPTGKKGFDFEACTGAVTENLFSNTDRTNPKKEWDPANNGRFDLVTFSFGGNNIGFSGILFHCVGFSFSGLGAAVFGAIDDPLGTISSWLSLAGCPSDHDMRTAVDGLNTGGNDSNGVHLRPLAEFYQQVAKDVVNPGGNVVVVGYPEIVEDPKFWPAFNKAIGVCQGLRKRDALTLRGLAGYLNQTIGQAVANANDNPYGVHFTFVDVNTGQPDHGVTYANGYLFEPSTGDRHNLCAAKPWLNGITTGLIGGDLRFLRSFHPTQNAHDAEGQLVASRILGLDWSALASPDGSATTSRATTSSGSACPDVPAFNDHGDAAQKILTYGERIDCEFATTLVGDLGARHHPWEDPPTILIDGLSCRFAELPVPKDYPGGHGQYHCEGHGWTVSFEFYAGE